MGKHKKFLRSEKAKVKLKGAKLPKGLNVTKTEFKIKKIILREQLQDEILDSGKKIHNIKEVLSRLKHHNLTFRIEALKQLKECFTYKTEVVHRNMGPIIQGIVTLSLDLEKESRRQSFKIFKDFLTTFNTKTLEPFYNIIASHLKCAMSHLNQSIQEDSLLFLDILLIYLPKLVMQKHVQIFSSFLDMISKLRANSKPGRTLTVNLGKKITTIKWRSKILDRLQRMLQIIIRDWKQNSKNSCELENQAKELYFDPKNWNSSYLNIQLHNKCDLHMDLSNIFSKSIGQIHDNQQDNGKKTKIYIDCLIPLLIESWIEVRPNYSEMDSVITQVVLSNEAAETLNVVLDIVCCLCEMVEIWESNLNSDNSLLNWFRNIFASDFNGHIFDKFPYHQDEVQTLNILKKKATMVKDLNKINSDNCLKQNLNLIYLYNIFNGVNIVNNKKFSFKVLLYLQEVIGKSKLPTDSYSQLEKTLRSILFDNGKYYLRVDEFQCKLLLRTLIEQYHNKKFSRSFTPNITSLVCDILSENNLLSAYGQNEFSSWLLILPKILTTTLLSERILKTLTNLGKRKNQIFLKALGEEVENVIESIDDLQIIESKSPTELKKGIINLFYWVDYWNDDIRNYLELKINQNIKDEYLRNYFTFIIKRKCFI